MSILPKAPHSMRIIAIPLTRPRPNLPPTAKPNRLTYYQFQISKPKPPPPQPADGKKKSWWPEEGVVNWATVKAGSIWAGFGKADGGWKLKTYQVGERLVDRLDFEELALKGIDPSLGPSITGSSSELKEKVDEAGPSHVRIPLIYPPSISSGPGALSELRSLLDYRTPRHRKGLVFWILVAPLTAPFMIIPIIPNLPFFFCVWRAWSHYRAYRASQYLTSLVESGAIVPEASEPLHSIYKQSPPALISTPEGSPTEATTGDPKHAVLLTRDAIPSILAAFGLKSECGADLLRAVEQARVRVQSGRIEL